MAKKRMAKVASDDAVFSLLVEAFSLKASGTAVQLTATTNYASCTLVSSEPTTCPLCHKAVPANRRHRCSRKGPR
jgi:hypothetical protein